METKKLTNLQLELLRIFSRELTEQQLLEIRALLVNYFSEKISDQMDELWDKNGWTEETMKEWTQEHMRTPYKPSK